MLVIYVLRRTVGWRQERMMFFFPSSAAGSQKLSCHLLLDLSARHSCISPFPCPLSKCDLITDRELIFHYRCLDRLLLITILSQKPLLLLSGLVFLNTGRVLWQNLAERKSEPWTGVAASPLGKISGLSAQIYLFWEQNRVGFWNKIFGFSEQHWIGGKKSPFLKLLKEEMYFTDRLQCRVDSMLARQPTDIWSRKSASNLHQIPAFTFKTHSRFWQMWRILATSVSQLSNLPDAQFAGKHQFPAWTIFQSVFDNPISR